MTIEEFRIASGQPHRGYSAGYDAGWSAASEGRPEDDMDGESWSYRDGYTHGYEDGQSIIGGYPMPLLQPNRRLL